MTLWFTRRALLVVTALMAACNGSPPSAPTAVQPLGGGTGTACGATVGTYFSEFPTVSQPARVYGRFTGTCPIARLVLYHDGQFALQTARQGDEPGREIGGLYTERGTDVSFSWDGSSTTQGAISHQFLKVPFTTLGIASPLDAWGAVHMCGSSPPSAATTRIFDRPAPLAGQPLSTATLASRFELRADGSFVQYGRFSSVHQGTYAECQGVITFHYEWYAFGAMATVWEGRLNVQYRFDVGADLGLENASYQLAE
jgi:hypothetical protein